MGQVLSRWDANTMGRFGPLSGPVSVCIVDKGSIHLTHVVVPVPPLLRFHFIADGSEKCCVFCRRPPYFSVNFAKRLPCTWLTRVMIVATAADPSTPECSREKFLLSLALILHETKFGFVHSRKKQGPVMHSHGKWIAHHRRQTSTSSNACQTLA